MATALTRRPIALTLSCAAVLALASCDSDDDGGAAPDDAPSAVAWERVEHFRFGNAEQMNSHATATNVFFQGNLFTVQGPTALEDVGPRERVTYGAGSDDDYDNRKLPLSDHILVNYSVNGRGSLHFSAADNPVLGRTDRYFSIAEHDTAFVEFELNSYWLGECMGLSDDGRALVPYYVYSDAPEHGYRRELRLALITIPIDTNYVYGTALGAPGMEVIRLGQDVYRTLLGPHAVEGGFVASDLLGTYHIGNDATVERVSEAPIDKFVTVGDRVYGISDRPPGQGPAAADIYASADQGRTWDRVAESDRQLIFLNYDGVGERAIAYRNDQLFSFDFAAGEGVELDNAGLDGASITSVVAHDSVAYVTTLSGVFEKPLAQLWDERAQ